MSGHTTSALEALPAELGFSILQHIPDTKTLHSLLQASPVFYSLYLVDRERFFTQATINELYSRNVDILEPARLLEVNLKPNHAKLPCGFLEALDALHAQIENSKRHLVLSIKSCKSLLTIQAMMIWDIVEEMYFEDEVSSPIIRPHKVPDRNSVYWSEYVTYHIIAMGEDRKNRMKVFHMQEAIYSEYYEQKLLLFGSAEQWSIFQDENWNAEWDQW